MTAVVVPYDPGTHERFVVGTWLASYAQAPHVRKLHRDLYYAYQRALIPRLMARSVTTVVEDDGLLLGWACAERVANELSALHYAFVKPRDRRMGLASMAWDACLRAVGHEPGHRVVVTHTQKPFSEWAARVGWEYRPAMLSERNHGDGLHGGADS